MRLCYYEQASLEAIKVPLIFREGYAAISLLIPLLNPMSSIAAANYPVGLDEDMGPEGTGAGPQGSGRF